MPIPVIDKASGAEIEVSAADLQDDIAAGTGRFVVPAGKVRVTDGTRVGTASVDNLAGVIASGMRLVDEDTEQAIHLKREASSLGSQALGTLEAAASGLTLGLSTLAQEKLGGDPERMAARREATGALGTGAEFLGAAIPTLASGGSGGLARGIARFTPAGRASGLAIKAGERAAAALPATAGAVRRVAVPLGTRGFVEGAAYGAGGEIDDGVLDRNLTVERVLLGAGIGGVLGGVAEPLIPGVIAAGVGRKPTVAKSLEHILAADSGAVKVGADGVGVVDTAGTKTFMQSMTGRALRSPWARKQFASKNNLDIEDVDLYADSVLADPKFVQKTFVDPTSIDRELADEMRPPLEAFVGARKAAIIRTSDEFRMKDIERKLPSESEKLLAIPGKADRELEAVESQYSVMLALKAEGQRDFYEPDIVEALGVIGDARRRIADRVAKVGRTSPREAAAFAHTEVNAVKRHLDNVAAKYGDLDLDRPSQNARDLLVGAPGDEMTATGAARLRAHVQNEAVYGDVGRFMRERNTLIGAAINLQKALGGSATGRVLNPATLRVDSGDLLTMVKNSARYAGQTKTELGDDLIAAEVAHMQFLRREADLDPETDALFAEQLRTAGALDTVYEKQRAKVRLAQLINRWKAIETNASVSSGLLSSPAMAGAAAIGFAAGGMPGAIVAGAASQLLRPHSMARKLAAIHARTAGPEGRFRKMLGDLGKWAGGASMPKGKLAPAAIYTFAPKARGNDRTSKAYAYARRVAEMTTDPMAMVEDLQRRVENIQEEFPELADEIVGRGIKAITYLKDKAPFSYAELQSPNSKPLVDPIALDEYERSIEGVEDPMYVISRIMAGTVTREHVEAVKHVYPEMWGRARDRVLEAASRAIDSGKELGLERATTMSLFLDAPLDPTLALAPGIRSAFAPAVPEADPQAQGQSRGTPRKAELKSDRETNIARITRGVQ